MTIYHISESVIDFSEGRYYAPAGYYDVVRLVEDTHLWPAESAEWRERAVLFEGENDTLPDLDILTVNI